MGGEATNDVPLFPNNRPLNAKLETMAPASQPNPSSASDEWRDEYYTPEQVIDILNGQRALVRFLLRKLRYWQDIVMELSRMLPSTQYSWFQSKNAEYFRKYGEKKIDEFWKSHI